MLPLKYTDPSSSSQALSLQTDLPPLFKILPEYERRFLTQRNRGASLNSYIHESLISARKSIAQYYVQRGALQAVLLNLQVSLLLLSVSIRSYLCLFFRNVFLSHTLHPSIFFSPAHMHTFK